MLQIQEENIIELFEELKEDTNDFTDFDTEILEKNSKIIIEVGRMNGSNISNRVFKLVLKGFRIKKFFPKIKTICALRSRMLDEKFIELLKEAFDEIVVNDFSIISNIIRKLSAEEGNFRL